MGLFSALDDALNQLAYVQKYVIIDVESYPLF
jgi:hypothetical protein